jgi:hypothetical protein
MKNRRLSRDWRLVSTLQAHVNWVDNDGNSTGKDEIFYYLFENGLGKRKIKHEGAGKLAGEGGYEVRQRVTHPYYLSEIRPWLEGRYDPDIPNYESIKVKEFKDNLAGKIT